MVSRLRRRHGFPKGILHKGVLVLLVLVLLRAEVLAGSGNTSCIEPTWESLDRRPVAPWWLDAKFGVYVHWTLASAPGWGNHSSFYWPNLLKSRQMEATGPRPAK